MKFNRWLIQEVIKLKKEDLINLDEIEEYYSDSEDKNNIIKFINFSDINSWLYIDNYLIEKRKGLFKDSIPIDIHENIENGKSGFEKEYILSMFRKSEVDFLIKERLINESIYPLTYLRLFNLKSLRTPYYKDCENECCYDFNNSEKTDIIIEYAIKRADLNFFLMLKDDYNKDLEIYMEKIEDNLNNDKDILKYCHDCESHHNSIKDVFIEKNEDPLIRLINKNKGHLFDKNIVEELYMSSATRYANPNDKESLNMFLSLNSEMKEYALSINKHLYAIHSWIEKNELKNELGKEIKIDNMTKKRI